MQEILKQNTIETSQSEYCYFDIMHAINSDLTSGSTFVEKDSINVKEFVDKYVYCIQDKTIFSPNIVSDEVGDLLKYSPVINKNMIGRIGLFLEYLFGKKPDNKAEADFGKGENAVEIKTKSIKSNVFIPITSNGIETLASAFNSQNSDNEANNVNSTNALNELIQENISKITSAYQCEDVFVYVDKDLKSVINAKLFKEEKEVKQHIGRIYFNVYTQEERATNSFKNPYCEVFFHPISYKELEFKYDLLLSEIKCSDENIIRGIKDNKSCGFYNISYNAKGLFESIARKCPHLFVSMGEAKDVVNGVDYKYTDPKLFKCIINEVNKDSDVTKEIMQKALESELITFSITLSGFKKIGGINLLIQSFSRLDKLVKQEVENGIEKNSLLFVQEPIPEPSKNTVSESKKKHKKKKPISAMCQVGGKVNAGIMDGITCGGMFEEGAEPESDRYYIGFEDGANSYAHVNEERGVYTGNMNGTLEELSDYIIKNAPKYVSKDNVVQNKKNIMIGHRYEEVDRTTKYYGCDSDNGKRFCVKEELHKFEMPVYGFKGKLDYLNNIKLIIKARYFSNPLNEPNIFPDWSDERWKEYILTRCVEHATSDRKYNTYEERCNDLDQYSFSKDAVINVLEKTNLSRITASIGGDNNYTATTKDGKEINWSTSYKDGKVTWLTLTVKLTIVDDEVVNPEQLLGMLYHEFQHAFGENIFMKLTGGSKLKFDDKGPIVKSRVAMNTGMVSQNENARDISTIIYVLYMDDELDAHTAEIYGALKGMNSKRDNFRTDIENITAYKEYKLAMEAISRLKEKVENGRINDYAFYSCLRDFKVMGKHAGRDNDGNFKWQNGKLPQVFKGETTWDMSNKAYGRTGVADVSAFLNDAEKKLKKLLVKIGKAATLHYDKSEESAAVLNESIERDFDYKKYLLQIAKYMSSHGLNVKPFPKIKLNNSEQDGLFIRTGYYAPQDKEVVLFTKDRHPKDILRSFAHEMIHHHQNLSGKNLSFSDADNVKDNEELEKLEAEAYLKGNIFFRKWTEYFKNNGKESLNEDVMRELSSSEVDLSSFNVKKELNPKFWVDEHLDSRIRLKLLDLADDFISDCNLDGVKPEDIIMTGSLANFNWNKQYSDIDLHLIIDFDDVDEDNKDFVESYFAATTKLWNEKHEDLRLFGFPVEIYVQDLDHVLNAGGVYSLEKDKWIEKPDRDSLAKHKANKSLIRKTVSKIATAIENLEDDFSKADGDKHKIEVINEKATKLFNLIKQQRSTGFEKDSSEMNNSNIVFKTLRRMNYIGKLVDLREKTYNIINSLD